MYIVYVQWGKKKGEIMPRIARYLLNTSFFHIMVQGINKEEIFKEPKDKEKYLSIINKYKEIYNIVILAYCIMKNHTHILIYSESTENLSVFMHRTNAMYAKYYNLKYSRVGYVFRDRFLSEPIYDERYLYSCINYIHLNPLEAEIVERADEYIYSSYREYINKSGITKNKIFKKFVDIENYMLNERHNDLYMDIDLNITKIIESRVKEFCNIENTNVEEILKEKNKLKELIRFLKTGYKITNKDIQKQLGIGEYIFRIL